MQLLFEEIKTENYKLKIAKRIWDQEKKDLCLIHGLLANSYWWAWLDYALQRRAIAIDLSGMGHSQWQTGYSLLNHANEVANLIQEPMWVAAHSYGGLVAYILACLYPEKVIGLILIDVPLEAWCIENISYTPWTASRYENIDIMFKAFKLYPSQPFPSKEIKRSLFENSIRKQGKYYEWLFDPNFLNNHDLSLRYIKQTTDINIYYIASSYSGFSQEQTREKFLCFAKRTKFLEIHNSRHAIMLEHPLLLSELILNIISNF